MHLYTYIDPPSEKDLQRACHCLESDGIIAYPTDLNWAFGCDAARPKALDKIRRLKPTHPKEQPFSLVCSSLSMASDVGNIDHQMYRYLKRAFPGPYTVLVKRNRSLPRQIKDKRQVVGIRIPASPLLLALVEAYGKPLATTSVPFKADGTPYLMGWEVYDAFSHGLDLLLDLGDEAPGTESTIIDFTDGSPVVVRAGAGDPGLFGG